MRPKNGEFKKKTRSEMDGSFTKSQITGRVWKSRKDAFWLAEIPLLNLMLQAKSKEEIPATAIDAIELLIDDPTFLKENNEKIFSNKAGARLPDFHRRYARHRRVYQDNKYQRKKTHYRNSMLYQ
jgi:predicted RNase H-like HicB family nuclease